MCVYMCVCAHGYNVIMVRCVCIGRKVYMHIKNTYIQHYMP